MIPKLLRVIINHDLEGEPLRLSPSETVALFSPLLDTLDEHAPDDLLKIIHHSLDYPDNRMAAQLAIESEKRFSTRYTDIRECPHRMAAIISDMEFAVQRLSLEGIAPELANAHLSVGAYLRLCSHHYTKYYLAAAGVSSKVQFCAKSIPMLDTASPVVLYFLSTMPLAKALDGDIPHNDYTLRFLSRDNEFSAMLSACSDAEIKAKIVSLLHG